MKTASSSSLIPPPSSLPSRLAEARPVLRRAEERLDHLGLDEVAVELVELAQPEVITLEVQRRLGRGVRVSLEVAEVLHQHEGLVGDLRGDGVALGDAPERGGPARVAACAEGRDRGARLGARRRDARVGEERVDVSVRVLRAVRRLEGRALDEGEGERLLVSFELRLPVALADDDLRGRALNLARVGDEAGTLHGHGLARKVAETGLV